MQFAWVITTPNHCIQTIERKVCRMEFICCDDSVSVRFSINIHDNSNEEEAAKCSNEKQQFFSFILAFCEYNFHSKWEFCSFDESRMCVCCCLLCLFGDLSMRMGTIVQSNNFVYSWFDRFGAVLQIFWIRIESSECTHNSLLLLCRASANSCEFVDCVERVRERECVEKIR